MLNKEPLMWLIMVVTVFTTHVLSAQFVKEKMVVGGNAINPNIYYSTDKKLIRASSNLQWSFVKDNISNMETMHPEIDGIALPMNGNRIRDYLILHGDRVWTEDDVQIKTVSQIKWGKYTENFVILCLTDSISFDFFNDNKWEIIISNASMVSKMLKAGRFKGVFLDNENYFEKMESFPWKFDLKNYPDHTFEEVKAKCRERGKAFMNALQSNISTPITLLNFFWFGDFWNDYETDTGRQVLYMPFMDGMLEASNLDNLFVDGNETGYWYHETSMFTDIYNEFRVNRFPKYGARDLQHKYKTQVQIGHGIYPNLYYDKFDRWPFKHTEEEQDTWWKHQLYNALLTSDKYVWIWSEKWDWWGNGGMALTPNFSSIIKEVKSKINNQQSLNYDLVNHSDNWKINLVKPTEKWHKATSPTVTITSPANKSKAGSSITLDTRVSNNASKVEFFINSMRVGVDSIAPYSLKVSGLARGSYTIFARAFDSKNEHTTSAPVIVNVGK
jgi:hypothetical protein